MTVGGCLLFWYASIVLGASPRPNVLIILTDDQRADTIAALGNPVIRTPNLDRLVSRGVSFDRAYMQGGFHGATCVPSRAMLLSGMPLFSVDEKLIRDPTWPEAFRSAGYTTFITGKWHNGLPSVSKCFEHAKAVFPGGMAHPFQAKVRDFVDGKPSPPRVGTKHVCEMYADEAIEFLSQPMKHPFFCYVPFSGPHDPHIVPNDFPITYAPNTIPLPPNFQSEHPFDNGELKIRDEKLLPWPRTPESIRTMNSEYYRFVSYLDEQIGRILDCLAASPHAQNTIVVFCADSGVARGSHGLIGKQNLYEHSIRVPLIVSGPGILQGHRTRALCYLYDVLPTIGAMCGVPAPLSSRGLNLSACLKDTQMRGRSEMLFAYRDVQRCYRDDRMKLIVYPKSGVKQLFDLQTDPHEIKNLVGDPKWKPYADLLYKNMLRHMTEMGDSLKLPSP